MINEDHMFDVEFVDFRFDSLWQACIKKREDPFDPMECGQLI